MSHKVYTDVEQTLYFVDPAQGTGGSYVSFGAGGILSGSGYRSDVRDLGLWPHATMFRWRAKTSCQLAPTARGSLQFFWSSFDNPADLASTTGVAMWMDGNIPSGAGPITNPTECTQNMQYIGSISMEASVSGRLFVSSGLTQLYGRYGQLVVFNNTGTQLNTATDQTGFTLTPSPDEIQ
jgi:hypothetical protein